MRLSLLLTIMNGNNHINLIVGEETHNFENYLKIPKNFQRFYKVTDMFVENDIITLVLI